MASCAVVAAFAIVPAQAEPRTERTERIERIERVGQVVRVEHYDPSTTPARGPSAAPVTVELFFAPSVNGAARLPVYRLLDQLQKRHPTRIRIVYRIISRGASPPGPQLPTLALEAHVQGRFFEFVDAIHAPPRKGTSALTRDQMIEVGRSVGLDPQRLESAIAEDRYRDVISGNERRFERLRGTNTPNVFFNDKAPRQSVSELTEADLERAYVDAYERAMDLLDRGVDPARLMDAFDAESLQPARRLPIPTIPTDDGEIDPRGHPLANPPLDLTGMPSQGKPGAAAAVTIAVLCRPNDTQCGDILRSAGNVQSRFDGEVRLVWAPWFDVGRDDAANLSLLGDAALCAELVGSNPDDLEASPGWRWITEAYAKVQRSAGRRMPADELIDWLAMRLGVDSAALSSCRARMANTTLDWIAEARRSGVTRSPTIVVGGRIYAGVQREKLIQQIVDDELAPGVLGEAAPAWRSATKPR
ncbi:MAG: DsbA family protein [Kofleriaceae bacterium]